MNKYQLNKNKNNIMNSNGTWCTAIQAVISCKQSCSGGRASFEECFIRTWNITALEVFVLLVYNTLFSFKQLKLGKSIQ